jgi:transposase
MIRRGELTDEAWAWVEPLLPEGALASRETGCGRALRERTGRSLRPLNPTVGPYRQHVYRLICPAWLILRQLQSV